MKDAISSPEPKPEPNRQPTLWEKLKLWFKQFIRPSTQVTDFQDLYAEESKRINDPVEDKSVCCPSDTSAGEPWIFSTSKDRFGLALSGGGIRSATFNLGLLQGLANLRVLKHIDYLSTVSGGGYVGGFWTRWLIRQKQQEEERAKTPPKNPEAVDPKKLKKRMLDQDCGFPVSEGSLNGERPSIRHLREFSRFLLPRVRILQTEFWGLVMVALGGLLPSLLAATAVLVSVWSVWLIGISTISYVYNSWHLVLGVLLLAYLIVIEQFWKKSKRSENNWSESNGYYGGVILGTIIAIYAAYYVPPPSPVENDCKILTNALALSLELGISTVCLIFLRLPIMRFLRVCLKEQSKTNIAVIGYERAMARFLALAIGSVVLALLWWLASKLPSSHKGIMSVSLSTGVSGIVFTYVSKWFTKPTLNTGGGSISRTISGYLKEKAPVIVAWITLILFFVLAGTGIYTWGIDQPSGTLFGCHAFWEIFGGALLIIFLTVWLFNPARVGMHEFYRTCIARCYLGASNIGNEETDYGRVADNRQTSERPGDDISLKDLQKLERPIHLICCTANNMSGDPLGNLYRGACSAVLSVNGISLKNQYAPLDYMLFSSALTASAAAFNSQMGSLSMKLGFPVMFLMSAFNLRLGMWVPHPEKRSREDFTFPGRFFIYELLGRSKLDKLHLHLSDGGHFENLAAYELIRRHCRYIIISDCGADPDVIFDDLANLQRRVREDFNVELELDVSSLRPDAERLSKQHAVVGTIHYDGPDGMDKGTIIYFKPTLTGDEPADILQYRARNASFPHEATTDQFYDEAQWESYRRLGEHAARNVMGFLDGADLKKVNAVDNMFRDARAHWQPLPDEQRDMFLELTARCAELEHDLIDDGPSALRSEFFSEATELRHLQTKAANGNIIPPITPVTGNGASGEKATGNAGTSSDPALQDDLKTLGYLLCILQIMEDVWVGADFKQYWSHPLNDGWMNYFQRWASTPSLRRWWPILSPIYSFEFREAAKERFGLGLPDPKAPQSHERDVIGAAQLKLKPINEEELKSSYAWKQYIMRQAPPDNISTKVRLGYDLELLNLEAKLPPPTIRVGFVLVDEKNGDGPRAAHWQADELFVPSHLYGGGIVARLLDALINYYNDKSKNGRPYTLHAHLGESTHLNKDSNKDTKESNEPDDSKDQNKPLGWADRYERIRQIEFYKSRGFDPKIKDEGSGVDLFELVLTLPLKDQ